MLSRHSRQTRVKAQHSTGSGSARAKARQSLDIKREILGNATILPAWERIVYLHLFECSEASAYQPAASGPGWPAPSDRVHLLSAGDEAASTGLPPS